MPDEIRECSLIPAQTDETAALHISTERRLSHALLKLEAIADCSCTIPRVILSETDKTDRFVFLQLMKGECNINCGDFLTNLKEKDCAFFPCGEELSAVPVSRHCIINAIAISGENLHLFYNEYIACGGQTVFHPICSAQYDNSLEQIKTAHKTPNCIQDLQLNLFISELLTALIFEARSIDTRADDARKRSDMQMVREYLEQHYKEKVTLEMLEKQFYFSRFYISYAFHEQFGLNISEYLNHVRIEEAKRLLAKTNNKIEAVAYQSGFGSASYFWRTFKAMTGISPSAYRSARRTK